MENFTGFDTSKYHLGRLCARGHDFQGTGKSLRSRTNHCLECKKITANARLQRPGIREIENEYRREYYRARMEQDPDYRKKYYYSETWQNRVKSEEYKRKRSEYVKSEKHQEWLRQYKARPDYAEKQKRYQANRGDRSEYRKKYYNSESGRAARRRQEEKRKTNPDRIAWKQEYSKSQAYREALERYRKSGKAHNIRAARRQLMKTIHQHGWTAEQWDSRCAEFENKCAYCGAERKLTMDHFIPVTKGGSHCLGNIIPACFPCNSSKHNYDPEQWYKGRDYFDANRWKKILKVLGKKPDQVGQIPLL